VLAQTPLDDLRMYCKSTKLAALATNSNRMWPTTRGLLMCCGCNLLQALILATGDDENENRHTASPVVGMRRLE